MSGYTPLFSSLATGTLCGKWPDIGLWAIVLALADWQGVVDATPHYISNVTGLPVTEVKACMQRFCEPDPDSRSKAEHGARLILVDPQREWGWRVVNIQLYRDRASGKDQIMDGRNAEKVRRYKERHRQTPADTGRHHRTPTHTTDLNTDSDSEKNPQEKTPVGKNARKRATSASTEFPLDFALDDALRAQALKRAPDCDVEASFAQFRAHHEARGAKFKNWRQAWTTWVGNYEQFGYPKRQSLNGKSLAEIYPGVKW